jgi:uncharacterized repeat protein (TIGR01451 family)
MKRLFLRIAALALLVALGLMAMGYAQHGAAQSSLPAGADRRVEASQPSPFPERVFSGNSREAQVSGPGTAVPTSKPAAVDPFAAQSARFDSPNTDAPRGPEMRNILRAPGGADASPLRPSVNTDRYAGTPDRNAAVGDRYATPGTSAPAGIAGGDDQHQLPPRSVGDRGEPGLLAVDPASPPARMATLPIAQTAARDAGNGPAEAAGSLEGTGQPGKKQLEGPQTPQLTIQKFAPEGIQVGKPATFRVAVVNTGQIPAHGVEVRDQIPKGTQLINTRPRATRGASGELVWDLGTVKPGEETAIEMQVMPVAEGEIGSVATVGFRAEASARTVATKPELAVKIAAPGKVMIGDQAVLAITVSNPGTGVATGVTLEDRLPPGLQHATGTELAYEVGTLKPGESRQLQLPLLAVRPGVANNLLVAKGEANLKAEERTPIEVVAPQLDVSMEGPKRRYLEREATYTVSLSNPGTAPARQVELVAYLPRGLKFVSAKQGQYEAATHTVHWVLEELPVNESDKVELVTLPVEPGEQKLRLQGKADKGLAVEREQPINVEGIAAVLFEVRDVNGPIAVGGETVYEIRVLNQGSKAATNIRLAMAVPPGLKLVAAEGPTRQSIEGNNVQFESLARLAPKADTTYRVRVQGLQPGDLRVRVQLLADEMQGPVTKEESTRVYRDE